MAHEVKVRQPLASVDLDVVQRALGETPPKVRGKNYVPAPFLTIDGRINPSTSFYLSHHCRSSPHLGTATRIAGDLKNWVDFLVNERHLPPFIDDRDPVLMATEDDWAAFYRRSQYPESDAPAEGRDTGAGAMTSERPELRQADPQRSLPAVRPRRHHAQPGRPEGQRAAGPHHLGTGLRIPRARSCPRRRLRPVGQQPGRGRLRRRRLQAAHHARRPRGRRGRDHHEQGRGLRRCTQPARRSSPTQHR